MTGSSRCSEVRAPLPHRKHRRVLTETQTEDMMGPRTLLLVSLLAVLAVTLAAGSQDGCSMAGTWQNISKTNPDLLSATDSAVSSFNNMSNDIFLFKRLAIIRARRKVVEGTLYDADLDMTRTVCRKRDNKDPSDCDSQPDGVDLHQTFQCHTMVCVTPQRTTVKQFTCSS